jgi:hypothetical protein
VLSISFRVTGSSIVASLLIDLIVVLKEDSVEGSRGRGPKTLVVLLLGLVINCLKLIVSNLRLLLVGPSLETVGSSIKVVEETIISFYSKGLLLYYRKSSLV